MLEGGKCTYGHEVFQLGCIATEAKRCGMKCNAFNQPRDFLGESRSNGSNLKAIEDNVCIALHIWLKRAKGTLQPPANFVRRAEIVELGGFIGHARKLF